MIPDEIETDRLFLRPFRFTDMADVLVYANNAEWARYLPVPTPYTARDAEEFLARARLQDRSWHPNWAIIVEDRAVGGIDIRFVSDHRLAGLGYSISHDLWNHGYTTEATRAVIDAAFTQYEQLGSVRSQADARNKASIRVMQKVGMTFDGCLRANRYIGDEFVDDECYSILRQEWSEGRA